MKKHNPSVEQSELPNSMSKRSTDVLLKNKLPPIKQNPKKLD